MPELDLFDKTELWLTGVRTNGARLPEIAGAAAQALSLASHEVFVTDVRSDYLVLDLVGQRVNLEDVVGRSSALLAAVGSVKGVTTDADAGVHSYGVLGILGVPSEQVDGVVAAATTLNDNLGAFIARRIAVVSTGSEMLDGSVHDTNFETIGEAAIPLGYEVTFGGTVGDEDQAIAGRVVRLTEDGHGVVITTGGVGAEHKDRTIEALRLIAPDLSTAVLASYKVGHGRHVKPDVRVGAGKVNGATVIALPGPTREVRAAMPALLEALAAGATPATIAEAVAIPIRSLWSAQGPTHNSNHPRGTDH